MKTRTKMKTRKRTTSLEEALSHGTASHVYAPWRVRDGKCQVGVPSIDPKGRPCIAEDGSLVLTWRPYPERKAKAVWPTNGWILE